MTTSLEEAPEQASAGDTQRGRAWGRLIVALAVLLLVVVVAAWLQRGTIAREFVDRELRRRGVPAQYQIEQLSPWRQRLTGVVIGDPRNPDLTADWMELRTSLLPWRAEVLELHAGKLRIVGRLVRGRLSLGAIDRLLPPSSGGGFALPHVKLHVADAGLHLDSGHGDIDLRLSGDGMLDDGFAGRAQVAAARLALPGCVAAGVTATLGLRTRRVGPAFDGLIAAKWLACGDMVLRTPQARLKAALGAALANWTGAADLVAPSLQVSGRAIAEVSGRISFDGTPNGTQGKVAIRSRAVSAPEAAAAGLQLAGDYRQDSRGFACRGKLLAESVRVSHAMREEIAAASKVANGSPLAPIVEQLVDAAAAAAARFDIAATLRVDASPGTTSYTIERVAIAAASGARMTFDRGAGIYGAIGETPRADGMLTLQGGGMPEAMVRLSQARTDDRLRGTGFVRPYAAGSALLSLGRIAFDIDEGRGTATSVATVSGSLPSGRVDRLMVPLNASWADRRVALNPSCEVIRYERVALAGAVLAPGRLQACPVGAAMVAISPGGIGGGVRLIAPALAGRVGTNPLRITAAGARVDLGTSRFALTDAHVRLGAGPVTRLDVGSLDGSFAGPVAGAFAGLGGQIGAVPLVLSGGSGRWHVADAALALRGKMQLADAVAPVRFHPLLSEDAELRLSGNVIAATAGLKVPTTGVSVAQVTIRHDLHNGRGAASVTVPGLRFAEGGLQPSDLTPLTFGLVADVSGAVHGSADISWAAQGVTSTGRFGTAAIDLAAAFGPVRGLATELVFADLLGMRTNPGQIASAAEINPGVPVRDGRIRFQLLDSQRVAVEGARWPFAGGELVLEPTVLDFSQQRERRMTFRVIGADAALFLKEMAFDNLDATGTFDGTLPMVFDAQGGRIEGGSLRARAGGSLAYVGEISQRDLGFWGNMAFQALKALDYKSLTIAMNGPLAGDMVTEIRFAGVSQGKGTKSNFLLRRLAKLPFVFNVRVSAPFKQLLDSVQSWYDPNRLIERNLPSLLEEQEKSDGRTSATPPVQPRESEPVRRKEP